jgi:hypothetical protein
VPGAQRYYPKGQGDPSAPKQPGTGNEAMIDQALRGSNTSDLATGNASGKVGVGEQTAAAGGERFGIEKPDRPYASQLRELGPLSGRVQSPVGQLGGPVGGMLDAVNRLGIPTGLPGMAGGAPLSSRPPAGIPSSARPPAPGMAPHGSPERLCGHARAG